MSGGRVAVLLCCTYGLAIEDGEVVRHAWSRAARMLTIMGLAWPEAGDHRWSSSVEPVPDNGGELIRAAGGEVARSRIGLEPDK